MNSISLLWHRIRLRLGGFKDGLGRPVPVDALNHEYRSGAWSHFFGEEEQERHERLVQWIRHTPVRPRLLDLGCGSGRLASMLTPEELDDYLGVDISEAGLELARALQRPAPLNRFEQRDFEQWTPEPGHFNIITFNECLGYAADPLKTAARFYAALPSDGVMMISHFRATNYAEFWLRLSRKFDFIVEEAVTNRQGKSWDLRQVRLRHGHDSTI